MMWWCGDVTSPPTPLHVERGVSIYLGVVVMMKFGGDSELQGGSLAFGTT